jgi:hypothetical protein
MMSTLEESSVAQRFGQWTHVCLMYNCMSFNIFLVNTILYGYCMSCHFVWYVERYITPQG